MFTTAGHTSMIGRNSKKVMGYAVCCKTCRVCDHASARKVPPRVHDFRKNWYGSAKAMEPSMVVEMIQKANEAVKIGTIIGDDDTTTIARVRAEVDESIKKCSDKNHVRKSLSNELYTVKDKHKHKLSVKSISHLQKCFTYAIDQNRGDAAGLAANLQAIVPHTFDNHEHCEQQDVKWCGYLSAPEVYRHKSLAHGKGLTGAELHKDLTNVFDAFIQNADKLAHLESSQANESFNNIVASKAPKNKHYSGSESLSYRVSAAVSQKNDGHTYITRVSHHESFYECITNLHDFQTRVSFLAPATDKPPQLNLT